jgi:chorismate mutase / prephenate dehydrogenase
MSERKPPPRTRRRPSVKALERHRAAIEALDARILGLVARRLDEAQAIGELKGSRGIPLRNFEVEAQVRGRLEALATGLGRRGDLGRDLALFLIERSLETQAPIIESAYSGDRLKALVVGGMGGMGRWLAGFLAGQGHDVQVYDVASGQCPWPRCADLGQGVLWADLVLVSVPMSACSAVLEAIGRHRPKAVVGEICSLKGHLLPTLERLRADGLKLVSLHPMFGPDVRMLSGRNIVVCTEGDGSARDLVKGLFASTSANLVEMSAAEHDRRMGAVLGLSHLANLAFARALGHSGLPFCKLGAASGVTFLKQVATTRDVVGENPELYYEIQALNAVTPETFAWLERALDDYRRAIEKGDEPAFVALMRDSASYFRED